MTRVMQVLVGIWAATTPLTESDLSGLNDKERSYLNESIAQRAQIIVQLDREIVEARKRVSDISRASVTRHEGRSAITGRQITRQGRFATQAEKDEALKRARASQPDLFGRKKLIEDCSIHFAPVIADLKVSAIGRLVGSGKSVRIIQIVGPDEAITQIKDAWVLLSGFSTTDLVDDKEVLLPHVIEVTGTYSYTTVFGAKRTILKAAPFDNSRVLQYEQTNPAQAKALLTQAVAQAKALMASKSQP